MTNDSSSGASKIRFVWQLSKYNRHKKKKELSAYFLDIQQLSFSLSHFTQSPAEKNTHKKCEGLCDFSNL